MQLSEKQQIEMFQVIHALYLYSHDYIMISAINQINTFSVSFQVKIHKQNVKLLYTLVIIYLQVYQLKEIILISEVSSNIRGPVYIL
jgi:hypothetical protein